MNRSHAMTELQRIKVEQLLAQGFRVDREEPSVVRMSRGQDARLVLMNGSEKRAGGQ